ncbi:MAG: dienelactone hydrolase family protein [Proteobacteria bacterium]|nr:dienelactone hydrolase family protein [Pseudomonadota bacterium]
MTNEKRSIPVSDGTLMEAHVAYPAPADARGGAILVIQEVFGVNSHIRDVTDRFAQEGYLALAPDLFHRTAPWFQGQYDDLDGARKHAFATTPEGMAADLSAAHQWLNENCPTHRVAAVGFCFGGLLSVVANAQLPLACAVSYYGSTAYLGKFAGDDFATRVHGPQLFFWGGLDRFIDLDARALATEPLRRAGKPFVSVEFSDADHGFNCDARASYNQEAAVQAWNMTLGFLRQHLG